MPHTWPPAALDVDQQQLIDELSRFATQLRRSEDPGGLYVVGPVGRGKTWLCTRFVEHLRVSTRRVHVHGFFRDLQDRAWHERLHGDPTRAIDDAVAALLADIDLLYFDEFQVHDPGDAALILRVLHEITERGIPLLTTSNTPPRELLPGPFHHVFEPGIELLEQRLRVIQVGGMTDYRRSPTSGRPAGQDGLNGRWMRPGTPDQLAATGLERPRPDQVVTLSAGGHSFTAHEGHPPSDTGAPALWISFTELCERPTSTADVLDWAATYDTWVISGVPELQHAADAAGRRFANTVDILCELGRTLHVISEHHPDEATAHASPPPGWRRMASRLTLLQLAERLSPS